MLKSGQRSGRSMPNPHPLIKFGVSAGLLGLVVYLVDWHQALLLVRQADARDLLLALGLLGCAYGVNGIRLARLQRRCELDMAAPLFWGSYYTGLLFNSLLPAGVGGDAVRMLFLARRGYSLGALVAAGLVDRFFGLLGLFGVAGLAILVAPSALPLSRDAARLAGAGALFCFVVGLWLLPGLGLRLLAWLASRVRAAWGQRLEKASQLFGRLLANPGRLLGPAALSLLSHALLVLAYASCGRALLPEISLPQYFVAVPGVLLVLALPISLGGLGVREVSTVGLLVWMGADPQAALTLSLVFLMISWISVLPALASAVHYGLGSFSLKADSNAR